MSVEQSAVKLEARIVEKPAFTVVGMLARVTLGDPTATPTMMQLWMDFDGQQERVQGRINREDYFGAMHNCDTETHEFDYIAGVEVKAGTTAPEGMVAWEIPAQTYAVFETTLPHIGAAFEFIYQTWLPGSDFERTDGPEFEYYGPEFSPEDPASRMSICVPVKQR